MTSAEPGIVLSHLSKSYGDIHAVRSIDLTIDPGETVALLGPNGAGKTTAIDLMLGLARPDAGAVSLFGRPPGQAVADGLVGGMLQTGSLIENLTVRELVAMVASLYPHPLAVDEVLELTGAARFANRRTTKLSGGQAQRVRFAIALVANPDLLLLDEPTAALDIEGRREFWTSMRAIAARGKTVIFATHHLDEADAYADRIVLLAGGEIVADGPANEIKARVGGATLRATVPDADPPALARLPGVVGIERRGESVILSCSDPDLALRALLFEFPSAHHIELQAAGLEKAFLALTATAVETDYELGRVR
jgi:ABC-2 type transport system ATP-binding protein